MTGKLSVAARSIRLFADKQMGPAALAKILADGAIQSRNEAIAGGEASDKFYTYVDGKEGASEYDVRYDGYILYDFDYMPDIVEFASHFLRFRSPPRDRHPGSHRGQVRSYKDSWLIASVASGLPYTLSRLKSFDMFREEEYWIWNRMPYGRKVDVQLIGKKRVRFESPPHILDDLVHALRQRYGSFIQAKRRWTIRPPDPWIIKRGVKKGLPVEYPAVLIEPRTR